MSARPNTLTGALSHSFPPPLKQKPKLRLDPPHSERSQGAPALPPVVGVYLDISVSSERGGEGQRQEERENPRASAPHCQLLVKIQVLTDWFRQWPGARRPAVHDQEPCDHLSLVKRARRRCSRFVKSHRHGNQHQAWGDHGTSRTEKQPGIILPCAEEGKG